MNDKVKLWLKGLAAALIGGASAGITAGFAAAGVAPDSFNLSAGLPALFKLAGACAIVNSVLSMAAYLKQSPIPPNGPSQGG